MLRKKHQETIDRLTSLSESNHHKREWVKFAFLRSLDIGERLTLAEWDYLADHSGFTRLWARDEYNLQESIAWHRFKLDPIEIELKENA